MTRPRNNHLRDVRTLSDRYLRIPGFILRGQILSITLATVLIGFILLREWITQHNWAEHVPQPIEREPEVNPDEWIVREGIAYRKEDTQQNAGVLTPTNRPSLGAENRQKSARNSTQVVEESSMNLAAAEQNSNTSLRSVSDSGDVTMRTEDPLRLLTDSKDTHRRTEVQRYMSLFQPVFDVNPTLTSSKNPVNDIQTTVTSAQLPKNPPEYGYGADVAYEAQAGPSRLSPDILASQSLSGYTSAVATSEGKADENPESLKESAVTSPGGGSPRPAAPPKPVAGMAYTAPELLSVKGKGKAKAIDANRQNETNGADILVDEVSSGLGISTVNDTLEVRSPLSSHYPSDGINRILSLQTDGVPAEFDSQDALVPDRRSGDFDPDDRIRGLEAASPGECLEAPDDQPADLAYRDAGFSSGQQSPSTVSERTLAASGDESASPSPLTAPFVLDIENAPGDRLPIDAADPLAILQNGPVNGGDVDVEFLEEDEDEDVHWEREDWNGVLEGKARRPRQEVCIADKKLQSLV